MKTILLYTTQACHLCEQAEALLGPVLDYLNATLAEKVQLRHVEISDSTELVEQYGIRIPVIKVQGQEQELGWPFDQAIAFAYLQGALAS